MPVKGLAGFNIALNNFTDRVVPEKVAGLQKRVGLEVVRRVIPRTPVDTGRARVGWQVSQDSRIDTAPEAGVGPSGGANASAAAASALQDALAQIAKVRAFSVTYIQNNVEYIGFLEGGSSKQAPNGMLGITLAEVRTIFRGTP
jgi:hypothetical protein